MRDEHTTAAAEGAAELAGLAAGSSVPRELSVAASSAADGAAERISAAARSAAAAVGPIVEGLDFDAPGALTAAVATLGTAFAAVSKCAVPPISLALAPLGSAVGAVLKQAELVRANKDACRSLASAALVAARTLFESASRARALYPYTLLPA